MKGARKRRKSRQQSVFCNEVVGLVGAIHHVYTTTYSFVDESDLSPSSASGSSKIQNGTKQIDSRNFTAFIVVNI
jgi:hypothetical protein